MFAPAEGLSQSRDGIGNLATPDTTFRPAPDARERLAQHARPKGFDIMAIVKNALILCAVIALLPTDSAQQAAFFEKSANAMHWTMTFCDRNRETCAQGEAMWSAFVKKAEFGAGVAYSLIQKNLGGDEPSVYPAKEPVFERRGTLKPDDLQPRWRGTKGADRGGA